MITYELGNKTISLLVIVQMAHELWRKHPRKTLTGCLKAGVPHFPGFPKNTPSNLKTTTCKHVFMYL